MQCLRESHLQARPGSHMHQGVRRASSSPEILPSAVSAAMTWQQHLSADGLIAVQQPCHGGCTELAVTPAKGQRLFVVAFSATPGIHLSGAARPWVCSRTTLEVCDLAVMLADMKPLPSPSLGLVEPHSSPIQILQALIGIAEVLGADGIDS